MNKKLEELMYSMYEELLYINNKKTEVFAKDIEMARKHTNIWLYTISRKGTAIQTTKYHYMSIRRTKI